MKREVFGPVVHTPKGVKPVGFTTRILAFNVGLKPTLKAFNVTWRPTSLRALLKAFNVGWALMSV